MARFSPAFFVSLISAALELTTRAILRTWSLIWLSFDRFARRRTETRKVSCIDINWLNFHLVRLSLSISLSLLFSLFILRFLLFEGPLPFSRNKWIPPERARSNLSEDFRKARLRTKRHGHGENLIDLRGLDERAGETARNERIFWNGLRYEYALPLRRRFEFRVLDEFWIISVPIRLNSFRFDPIRFDSDTCYAS